MKLRPPYDHQKAAIDKTNAAFTRGVKRVLLQAPTGFGKTLTAAHLIAPRVEQGQRVCFVVPRLALIDQSVEAFGREGLLKHIGVIQGRHPLTNHRRLLQIASRDTLTRRQLPKIDLFIVDEAHMVSKALLKLLGSAPDTPVIGLSATPWTQGLGKHFHELIVAETTQGLIEKGYLSPFKVFAPAPEPDLRHVKTTAGDFNQSQLAEALNKREIIGDIVRHWLLLGENRQTLCFAVDRAHAKHICQRFVEAGVTAEYVDCHTTDLDRREIIDRFRRGETRIICNVGVLTTGFDVPITSCIIDAHPTRSEMLHVQTIGRGLRPSPGKKDCIILDHAGNSLRLGLVTDIIKEELCDGSATSAAKRKSKEKTTPLPRLCDECKAVIPPHLDTCPQCGAVKVKITKVRATDGELVAFGSGDRPKRKSPSIEEMREFYGELKFIGRKRNRSQWWPAFAFKDRFGFKPTDSRFSNVEPRQPSIATVNFVRSRDIAFAKSREKGRRHG